MRIKAEVKDVRIFSKLSKEYKIKDEKIMGYSLLVTVGDDGGTFKCSKDLYDSIPSSDIGKPVVLILEVDTDNTSKPRVLDYYYESGNLFDYTESTDSSQEAPGAYGTSPAPSGKAPGAQKTAPTPSGSTGSSVSSSTGKK